MFITNKVLSQVIPMITIMMHSLDRTENDYGVIGWKAKLKESINQRLGRIEFEEQYSVATLLDPRLVLMDGTHHYNYVYIFRYKQTFFRDQEALDRAKTKLVTLVEMQMGPTDEEHVVASTSFQTSNQNEESSSSMIEQISKKIRLDKQVLALNLITAFHCLSRTLQQCLLL